MCMTFSCELRDVKNEQTANFRTTLPTNWKKIRKKNVSALQQTRELIGARNISEGANSCTKDVTQTQQRVG